MAISRRKFVAGLGTVSAAAIAGESLAACSGNTTTKGDYDKMFINGVVYTGVDESLWQEAVGIKDGKITYVGSTREAQKLAEDNVIEDLQGQMLTPGFVDGHVHIYIDAENQAGFDLGTANDSNLKGYLDVIEKYIKAHPKQDFYRGFGWLDNAFIGGTPTAAMLDKVCKNKPIFVLSEDCHSAWVNSALLKQLGVDKNTPNPIGGVIEHDKNGNPNGCFRDTAMDTIVKPKVPAYSLDEYKDILLTAQTKMIGEGYTAYNDIIIDPQNADVITQAYHELDEAGELKCKINAAYLINNTDDYVDKLQHAVELRTKCNGDHYKITDIKIFIDGIVESETAYLSKPYVGTDKVGADRWPGEEGTARLNDLTKRINDEGFNAHFHAIGDAACTKALDALEYAQECSSGYGSVRNVITHFQMINDDDIARMAKLGVIGAANLGWAPSTSEDIGSTNIEKLNVGEERNNAMYPFRTMMDAGIIMSNATDYPAGPNLHPLLAVQNAAWREYLDIESTLRDADQRLSTEEALDCLCVKGHYQLGHEATCGTIEIGKDADFVTLSEDITSLHPGAITLLAYVTGTYIDGNLVYQGE